jgi:hypothetical protein
MAKTGEKYSTARQNVLARQEAGGQDGSAEQATAIQPRKARKATPQWMDERAFWRFFPRNTAGSKEGL